MQDDEFADDDGPDEAGAQEERGYTVYVTVTYSGYCMVTATSANEARIMVGDGDYGDYGINIYASSPDELEIDGVTEN